MQSRRTASWSLVSLFIFLFSGYWGNVLPVPSGYASVWLYRIFIGGGEKVSPPKPWWRAATELSKLNSIFRNTFNIHQYINVQLYMLVVIRRHSALTIPEKLKFSLQCRYVQVYIVLSYLRCTIFTRRSQNALHKIKRKGAK